MSNNTSARSSRSALNVSEHVSTFIQTSHKTEYEYDNEMNAEGRSCLLAIVRSSTVQM